MDVSALDHLPEEFYQINDRQLMYLWHCLSDSLIEELYKVSKPKAVKKDREFGINPIASDFDDALREICEINRLKE